jgi:hypothetical protein
MIQKIEFKSEIPFGAWLYCDLFGWGCQNKSLILSPEIRLRQGFTHYSTDQEKPEAKPSACNCGHWNIGHLSGCPGIAEDSLKS